MTTRTVLIDGVAKRRADQIRPGDRLDLEGDAIADPSWREDDPLASDHPEFAYEFERVLHIGGFGPKSGIRLDFESGFVCWFPHGHLIDVDGEQPDDEPPMVEGEPGRFYWRGDREKGWFGERDLFAMYGEEWRQYVEPG